VKATVAGIAKNFHIGQFIETRAKAKFEEIATRVVDDALYAWAKNAVRELLDDAGLKDQMIAALHKTIEEKGERQVGFVIENQIRDALIGEVTRDYGRIFRDKARKILKGVVVK
jgi:hypothetical protein